MYVDGIAIFFLHFLRALLGLLRALELLRRVAGPALAPRKTAVIPAWTTDPNQTKADLLATSGAAAHMQVFYCQGLPRPSRACLGLPGLPRAPNAFQGLPRAPKAFQNLPRPSKALLRLPGPCKAFQGLQPSSSASHARLASPGF